MSQPLTRTRVFALAWPVVLAQVATATTGIVDTAVMGSTGMAVDLAAVALAAVTFNFIYWSFGFLRMSTTGLTAQALGAGDRQESRAVLARTTLLGAGIGLAILVLAPAILAVALALFGAAPDVEAGAGDLLRGPDLGRAGDPRQLRDQRLAHRRGTDAFAAGAPGRPQRGQRRPRRLVRRWAPPRAGRDRRRYGDRGVGRPRVRASPRAWRAPGCRRARIADGARLRALLATNRDILIRTVALVFAFAWFANSGAKVGTAELAGNQVLLQFITVSAFVLDAFAFVTEKEAGEAFGSRDPARLRRAVRLTSEIAVGFAAAFTLLYFVGGTPVIGAIVADPAARDAALAALPLCAVVPLLGVAAWQLDGVFLGTTQGRAVRMAAVAAVALYVASDLLLAPQLGNTGVWVAFLLMYVYRAAGLAAFWPGLVRSAGVVESGDPR